jgi:anthranilate/para-aminobenzoate synthase component II
MAEGIVDRPAGYLVRAALLIHRQKARSEIVISPGPDSISDAATMTSGLQEYQSFHINIKMIRALCSSA